MKDTHLEREREREGEGEREKESEREGGRERERKREGGGREGGGVIHASASPPVTAPHSHFTSTRCRTGNNFSSTFFFSFLLA